MPTSAGALSRRIALARDLLSKKGRREQSRFSFEGATLLGQALDAGAEIEEIYSTQAAYESSPQASRAESGGIPVYIVDERALNKISDLETPPGIVAVARSALDSASSLLEEPGLVPVLAGVGDPGNAGTLLRSAEAFGVRRVIFGAGAVDPYLPKVVRAAMGATFRLRIAVCEPEELAAASPGWQTVGLAAGGSPIDEVPWTARDLLFVGSERQGLGSWAPLCRLITGIAMAGEAESLNAAVAGSIALYEATKRRDSLP